ncbi:MAG: DUF5615 family PIN-like protein [Deltaproteobacteria bacterium]
MSLRFFVDHCIPNSVFQELLDADYEVFRLKDYIPLESADRVVISTAQDLDSILISLDGDFADTLNYPPSKFKGIIALQIRNRPEITPQLMARLMKYLSSHPDMSFHKGKLLVAEVERIRIRE